MRGRAGGGLGVRCVAGFAGLDQVFWGWGDTQKKFLRNRLERGGRGMARLDLLLGLIEAGLNGDKERVRTYATSAMSEERAKGNYVIAGGDWNHAISGSLTLYPSVQQVPDWVAELKDSDLPEGFSVVAPDNLNDVPTCRGDDIPYEKDKTYTTTVDGWIVSDNVVATARNIDTQFAYSDHNPVLLSFTLKSKE